MTCTVLGHIDGDKYHRLEEQHEALQRELLTPEVFTRIVMWLNEEPIRPATIAFTAGIERQIAYALELDVVPLIKRARTIEKSGK